MKQGKALEIMKQINQRVIGKEEIVKTVLCALLAKGHVLLDDIPGLGKTTLALAFGETMGLKVGRMQFTPDVLPSDVLGFNMYQGGGSGPVFHPGAVFCNMFLGDEINRTSPKTQSALLEVMEEGTVTIDGLTRKIEAPFFVMATQNPVGSVGTQMLPESQMDRFMVCTSMGYPSPAQEVQILKQKNQPGGALRPVVSREEVLEMQEETAQVFVHDLMYDYIVRLVQNTRNHPHLELGGSPRATIALMNMSMANAYISGRDFVTPVDVAEVFLSVMNHRVLLNRGARLEKLTTKDVLEEVLSRTPRPTAKKSR